MNKQENHKTITDTPSDNEIEIEIEVADKPTILNLLMNKTNENEITTENEPRYKNLVLSGGGIKGIAFIGALKQMVDKNLINPQKLKAIAGTSAGAMFALFIVLGFSADQIWDFIYCLDTKKLIEPDFLMLVQKYGIESGQIIYDFYEEVLRKKTGIKNITFKQLYDITNIRIIMTGSCLTTKEIVYYDHIHTPQFQVSMALRITISIPIFFTPVIIDNKTYIDGAVLNNYAMNLFEDNLDETIGLYICGDFNTNYKCPEEYFTALFNLLKYYYYKNEVDKYQNNTIYISDILEDMSAVSFYVDNKTKLNIFNKGISAVNEFIKKKQYQEK